MKTNEEFLQAMRYMDATIKNDAKLGHPWTYCNVTKKKARDFESARKINKHLINCVDGVAWAGLLADIPSNAFAWYGGDGTIVWMNGNAKKNAEKVFKIIKTGGKTVLELYKNGDLCDGDILTGFQGFNHTCAYFGGERSFDTGHANCSGETFKRFISTKLTHRNHRPNYILRIKDRAHYRVQAGAYSDIKKYNEQVELMKKKGFKSSLIIEDDMYKVQAGFFAGKTNAERLVASLKKKGISAYVKEV